MIRRQPIGHVRWHQKLLITINKTIRTSHDQILSRNRGSQPTATLKTATASRCLKPFTHHRADLLHGARAYPEESAYPEEIPYQPIAPLQYTVKPGQAYVLADDDVDTDYYYAKTYDDSLPGDHTVVSGEDEYYQIWFGHRIAHVRAADVRIRD